MSCKQCGLSHRNEIHRKRDCFYYHVYVDPPEETSVLSLEERIEALERAVAELKEERTT